MIVKTKVFELCNGKYKNLSELAQAMGISVSQVYRVRGGKRNINQKFLVGAIRAFPKYNLGDLFYLTPESPTVTNNYRYRGSAAEEEQRTESTQQALKKFTSATDRYGQHLNSHISALVSLNEASQELKKGAEEANKVLSYLIRRLHRGERIINGVTLTRPRVAAKMLEQFQGLSLMGTAMETLSAPLTPRELEVLDYVAQGYMNKQIAYKLSITEQTIKNHMNSILHKLDANDRTQAVVLAMHYGWISPQVGESPKPPKNN